MPQWAERLVQYPSSHHHGHGDQRGDRPPGLTARRRLPCPGHAEIDTEQRSSFRAPSIGWQVASSTKLAVLQRTGVKYKLIFPHRSLIRAWRPGKARVLTTLRISIDVPFYWAAGRPVTPQCHDFRQEWELVTMAIGKAQMEHATALRSHLGHELN